MIKIINQTIVSLFLVMLPIGAYAQNRTVHGVVKDAGGETVIGAKGYTECYRDEP